MAEGMKYKLGDMEFDTEAEYRAAAADLKRIKTIMDKYDIANPEQARRILASVKAHPEMFQSPYGQKFLSKLKRAAGVSEGAQRAASQTSAAPGQKQKKQKSKKEPGKKKAGGKTSASGGKPGIFTVRNFIIGLIIIVGIVAFSMFAPQLFSMNEQKADSGDIRRNMVTAYAKAQTDLKAQLYAYYFNVVGETEDEAMRDAEAGIANYVVDLSEKTVSRMTDSEIQEVYDQLVSGGDIQNNSFVEPAEITVLKEKLTAAGLSGNTGSGPEGENAVSAVINSMMDYQERVYHALCYEYSLLNYGEEDCKAFATEDMTRMFGDVIYDYSMTEEDKQAYYDSFVKRGFIKDNRLVRITTDPTEYNLPELTPAIELTLPGASAEGFQCSMISYAPGSSVFYEIHQNGRKGCLCFRNNGNNTNYIQLEEDTSVTTQGDVFVVIGDDFRTGEWFYNNQDVGLLINGDHNSKVSYVHDLAY